MCPSIILTYLIATLFDLGIVYINSASETQQRYIEVEGYVEKQPSRILGACTYTFTNYQWIPAEYTVTIRTNFPSNKRPFVLVGEDVCFNYRNSTLNVEFTRLINNNSTQEYDMYWEVLLYNQGDINYSGSVNADDIGILVANWGSSEVEFDLNHDGEVNGIDLSIILANWAENR
jgi:hypothetical protein